MLAMSLRSVWFGAYNALVSRSKWLPLLSWGRERGGRRYHFPACWRSTALLVFGGLKSDRRGGRLFQIVNLADPLRY